MIGKDEVAAKLNVTLPPPYETNGRAPHTAAATGTSATTPAEFEPVELVGYPAVQAALDRDTGDRSDDIARVVGACPPTRG
jgi:hypothetical protein